MDEPVVLELRIHGVNNTPPAGMLDLPAASVEQIRGDALASFWGLTPDAKAKLTEHDRGFVPDGIVREAYSWGGMARNSIGGASGFSKVVGVVARIGWMLLLPFGLVNVAYWSRRLDDGEPAPGSPATARVGWRQGKGAATLRLAGLLLTLLMATTVAVIPMDLIGVQCYPAGAEPCSKLPSQLGFLATWKVPQRLALLSLVPLLVIAGLWLLATITRTSYERASSALDRSPGGGSPADAATATKQWPLLRTPGFWYHHVITGRTALLHLAAVAVLLEILTAWHVAFGTGTACVSPTTGFGLNSDCWHQASHSGARGVMELILIVFGALLMLALAVLLVHGSEEAVDVEHRDKESEGMPWLTPALAAAGFLFVVQLGVLAIWRGPAVTAPRMLGISTTPAILISLLLGLSLLALYWRHKSGWVPLSLGLLFSVALLLSGLHWWGAWPCRAITALVGIGMVLVAVHHRDQYRKQYEAWRGCAPGVFLLLALLLAMTLFSAVVVAVGNLLNGAYSVASLAGGPAIFPKPALDQCPAACPAKVPSHLLVPQPYVWFGAAMLAALVILLATLLIVAVRVWAAARTNKQIIDPNPVPVRKPPAGTPISGYREPTPAQIDVLARNARRFAQLTHCAEPIVGLVATIGSSCLAASLLVAVAWVPRSATKFDAVVNWALGAGLWVLAGAGALVIGLAVGGTAVGGKRPLGLLWDLICFLPRAGHPFGPPCYAERVVPELLGRYDTWFSPAPGSTRRDPTAKPQIILSAHSLGSVLAVATIFAADGMDPPRPPVDRLSLLSYGSQLRAYFGRIFPELLGPAVLGNAPCRAARLLDPNAGLASPEPLLQPVAAQSLSRLLNVDDPGRRRWLSLWRRTDYIGFPVYNGGTNNAVDSGAQEIDNSGYLLTVLSHSDYPRTPAYRQALDDLVE
jgi:hypothetical protein